MRCYDGIGADHYELASILSDSLGELNLYSYCTNNLIIYTDEIKNFLFKNKEKSVLFRGPTFHKFNGLDRLIFDNTIILSINGTFVNHFLIKKKNVKIFFKNYAEKNFVKYYFSITKTFMLPAMKFKKYFLNYLGISKHLITNQERTICDRGKTAVLFL